MLRNIFLYSILGMFSVGMIVLAGMRDESIQPNRFDCRMLIGGWHPDVPAKITEQCRKGVKT